MLEIPRRISLTSQIAAAIRKGIEDGVWDGSLPGERRLCELFQASRPTIHGAMRALAKEGWFEIRPGRRNQIRTHGSRRSRHPPGRSVGIIVHEPFSHLGSILAQGLNEMRVHLAAQGFTTEVYVSPVHTPRAQTRGLESFIRQSRVSCCVLVSTSRAVQRWFSEHSLPALVLGSCHPSVRLPSLDVDYRAVCRHAAGHLLRKGHRHLALVVPDFGTAGDLASEQSFKDAVEQHNDGARASIVRHSGTSRSIASKLDTLFKSRQPPTALLVARTPYVFAVIMHLLNRGIGVPAAVSLIARDSELMFEQVDPPLAHYAFKSDAYVRLLCRLMLQMLNERLSPKPILIVPKFVAGRTVQSGPAAAIA
jgi:DNA-binding LacI/PurR family transcriptional regulator